MNILKDSSIYVAGELFAKIIPFLLLPYLSHKLGVTGYGQLAYYQTYLSLFVIFLLLGQDGAVARYFYFYGKRSLNLVLIAGYTYTIVLGGCILLFCFFLQAEMIAYLAISAIFQSLVSVQLAVRQCQKQAAHYTMIQILSGSMSALITLIMLELWTTDLVQKRILAVLLSNIIIFAITFGLYLNSHTVLKKFSFTQYKLALNYILGFGTPLLLHHGSLFIRGQLDKFLIFYQFSEQDLGLYAMGTTIASVAGLGIAAINKATLPYYYEALKKQTLTLSQIHQWALISLLLVPIPALVMWLIPETWLVWILGKPFLGTKYYVIMFLIATSLSIPYLLLVNYLFYHGKNKLISLCSALTTVIYVLALLILMTTKVAYVPYASILGALLILPFLYVMTKKVK